MDRKDVKEIYVLKVDQSEIEIRKSVCVVDHRAAIRLGTTIIGHVISTSLVEPGRLHLNPDKRLLDFEYEVVWKSITHWVKNVPSALQSAQDCCLLRNVSLELGRQNVSRNLFAY